MTCRHTVSLGAYLLGALDPADRPEFERHLDTCPMCSAEMLRLAPLPGLLQRVTPEDFEAIQQADNHLWPAELVADPPAQPPVEQFAPVVLTPVEPVPEPKVGWWRKRGVTLVAAAAVVLLAVGGVIMFRPDDPERTTVATEVSWSAVDPTTGVHGRVDLTGRAWGTEMKVSMQDVPAGKKVCHLVVHSRDGSSEVAGKWTAGYYREISAIPGSSSIKLSDIDRVEVIAGGGVLVGMQSP